MDTSPMQPTRFVTLGVHKRYAMIAAVDAHRTSSCQRGVSSSASSRCGSTNTSRPLALIEAGFEKRGETIRLVQTLRGGDRPKNAHKEFDNVTVMPRSCWEPWGLFRKPCEGRVQDNLRKWKTGGLRRVSEEQPFFDVIRSAPTRGIEREIAPHPSLKPQAFMRQIVRAALPLGEGIVLDPFMGGGSTIAAACAVGYQSIGIESDPEFYQMAVQAIPRLAALVPNGDHNGMLLRPRGVMTELQRGLFEQ